jgi:putative heme iron utilization protein
MAQEESTRPSLAEQARTLMHVGRVGMLSTLSERHPDWPFGSVMPYGLDDQGRPTFLISSLAMHTRNLRRDPRASLLVAEDHAREDPLGSARLTLLGSVAEVPDADLTAVREGYLERHPQSEMWVDFGDFNFYRMNIMEPYYVGGFGVMGWVSAGDYMAAEADPLADIASSVIQHMNDDHADALVLMARHFGGCAADSVRMTGVDRLGCDLQAALKEEAQGLRITFRRQARNGNEIRRVLTEMTQQARAATT